MSYFIDVNTVVQPNLLAPTEWTTTSRVCFRTTQDVIDDPDQCFEMVFARESLTFNYATAFVEVSEWLDVNQTSDQVFGDTYHDLNSLSGEEACFSLACGLTPPTYDAKIVLKSNDPESNISCYGIELKSATSRQWPLFDHILAIYFDGSHGAFESVSGSLPGYAPAVIDDLFENNQVEGSGNLSFEDNHSFVWFSIAATDAELTILTNEQYTEIAEICIDFTDSQVDPSDCLEIVYGREGLTDEYDGAFTQIYTYQFDKRILTTGEYQDYDQCNSLNCDHLVPPGSPGDVSICDDDVIPAIAVNEVEEQSARWFTTPQGGAPIATGISFVPDVGGIYYAEAYRENDGCISATRTAVALIVQSKPSLEIINKLCNEDGSGYSIHLLTTASSVESDIGVINKGIGDEWEILDIEDEFNVQITLVNELTGCTRVELIEAPNCACPLVSDPVSDGDPVICLGTDIPSLTVNVTEENVAVDWYSTLSSETPLVSNQQEFMPQDINQTGVYAYYAEARSLENGCVSSLRTLVTLTVLEPPVYAFITSDCSDDIQAYTSLVYSDAISIESQVGQVENLGNGVWRISNVSVELNLSLSITSQEGCLINREISAPTCDCNHVDAPVCGGVISACEGEDYEEFKAMVYRNQIVKWYDAPTGGTLLNTGHTFKPNLPGKYYAEAMDSLTGCSSQERTEVELILNQVPDLRTITDVFCANQSIVWSEIVEDLNQTTGTIHTYGSFRDALTNENPIENDSFNVSTIGSYFIKKTTEAGCFDIEIVIIIPEDCDVECRADAGTLIPDPEACFDGFIATLEATEGESPSIPTDYVQAFIITQGENLIVVGLNEIPEYIVESPGIYRIHSFVFLPFDVDLDVIEPVSSLNDFLPLLEENGGSICASIDIEGALFDITECVDVCPAQTLNPEPLDVLCYDGIPVQLPIDFNPIDAIIPDGFTQIFVLTKGPDLTIIGIENEIFEVDESGEFRVHSFVFDANTFDGGIIELGVTTGYDVFALSIEGGGDICASFDLNGAFFFVDICIKICEAFAGTTIPLNDEVCLNGDDLQLPVSTTDDLQVPIGFSHTFILTQGLDLIVIDIQEDDFTVNELGDFAVHSLVYDPATFDISSIVFGEDDIFSLFEQFIEGGGETCGSVDLFGAFFFVEPCELIDLELSKTVDNMNPAVGEEITFTLNIDNNSSFDATGVQISDRLPDGFTFSGHISDDGIVDVQPAETIITWSNLAIPAGDNEILTFTAFVNPIEVLSDFNNVAEVSQADQDDVDSTPDNDDGDQSEDDEDSVEVTPHEAQIDLEIVNTVSKPEALIGERISFNINLANKAMVVASGIEVVNVIPSGLDLNSIDDITHGGILIGQTIVWGDLGLGFLSNINLSYSGEILTPGQDIAYKNTVQVTAADQPDIDSTPNNDDGDQSEDDEDSAEVIVRPLEICDNDIDDDGDGLIDKQDPDCPKFIDIEVEKIVDDLVPGIGDIVNYQLIVTNNGPDEATGLILQDVTPQNIDIIDISGPYEHDNNGVFTWTIDQLGAGEVVIFEYSAEVLQSDSNDYTNIAQIVAADQADTDSTPDNDDGDQSEDDEDSVTLTPDFGLGVDLELHKYVDVECFAFGYRTTFYIDVINNSELDATGVGIEDILPDGLIAPALISNEGSGFRTILWSDLNIEAGGTLTLSYTARVKHDATDFTNIAQVVASDQHDIDSTPNNDDGDQSEDDEVSLTITPGDRFDLELDKEVDNPYARPGDRVRFDIILTNKGCVTATGVAVKDVIPSGYRAPGDISDNGERNANVIIWEDLSIEALSTKTLSFTLEVVDFALNCDYINIAEIIAADQEDLDSSPNNDDGDQSEDDEDRAEVFAGSMADLEVTMTVDKESVTTGESVQYIIKVCNNGPANATHVEIRDHLPDGIEVSGDLNFKGQLTGNMIAWSNFTFVAGDCLELIVNAVVGASDVNRNLVNSVEVVLSDQLDPDSSPGNGAGEGDEDDYSVVEIQHLVPVVQDVQALASMVEARISTALFLEGAYNSATGEMRTTLNELGYLPGQNPESFFAKPTSSGQPYRKGPWKHNGNEGLTYDYQKEDGVSYPNDVVDWVLLSLRTDLSEESAVFTQAALLLKDGSVVNSIDALIPLLDANQSYYLIVHHRNHLPIMSPTKLDIIDGKISFDFRFNESYTNLLGSGQKDVNGIFCVYAANGDQFSKKVAQFDINVSDLDQWFNHNGLNSAYMEADYDMNGDVNVQDQIIWLLNNGVFSDVPD